MSYASFTHYRSYRRPSPTVSSLPPQASWLLRVPQRGSACLFPSLPTCQPWCPVTFPTPQAYLTLGFCAVSTAQIHLQCRCHTELYYLVATERTAGNFPWLLVVVNYCSHAPTEAQVRTQPRVWSWELQATKKQSLHRCKMPPGAEYLTGFPHLGHPRSSPHPHPDLCLAMHMPFVPSKGRTVQRQPQCLQEHSLIPSLLPHKMFERFSQDQLVTTLDIRLVSQYNKPSFRVPVIELKLPCIRWQRR